MSGAEEDDIWTKAAIGSADIMPFHHSAILPCLSDVSVASNCMVLRLDGVVDSLWSHISNFAVKFSCWCSFFLD